MSIDLSLFLGTYMEEARDHLADLERLLLHIDPAAADPEDLDSIFRAAHSIKGGAGMFGFTRIAELTHILESLLDAVRSGKRPITAGIADLLLEAVDVLRALLREQADGEACDEAVFQGICARLQGIDEAEDASPRAGADDDEDADFGFFEPLAEPEGHASAPPQPEDESFGLFAPLEDAVAPPPVTAVSAVTPAVQGAKASVARNAETASIRVSVERVDQLINLVGELVITQAMLTECGISLQGGEHERLQHSLELLARNTRDLQEAVMSIRMLPISFVFNRFPRVVRDLAQKLDKQVELIVEGEGTELDRGLIEKLVDPLTHLVRNSIDHGIESAHVRLAAGKPARGRVTLRAYQRGGNIVVEVADDGAGLNRERILAKAREQGLPVHDAMADVDVWQLVFAPGFSTASEVTDVSGRGVGMDVVKRNIAELGGRVDVESVAGQGACFTIRLPLTLAILDGMSVSVGGEVFIVPLAFILESLQPDESQMKRVSGSGEVVHVRGEYLPLVPLHAVLGLGDGGQSKGRILLLVQADGEKVALQVDELLGQHQVVIKSLEANYRRVGGVSGATVMGDGRVALILDVADLVRSRRLARAA